MSCKNCKKKISKKREIAVLDGWTIKHDCYNWIRNNIVDKSIILELGSGMGTEILSRHYTMYSVEHNPFYVDKWNSTYLYTPIINFWYDTDILSNLLSIVPKYDLLIIDSPPRTISNNRMGLIENLNLFDLTVPIIVTESSLENDLSNGIIGQCSNLNIPKNIQKFKSFNVIY